jgi:hypothetical protein
MIFNNHHRLLWCFSDPRNLPPIVNFKVPGSTFNCWFWLLNAALGLGDFNYEPTIGYQIKAETIGYSVIRQWFVH